MIMKKIIFLDFDGVMDTAYYNHVLNSQGLPECDEYGAVFDPDCVENLKYIIEQTGADLVVTSSWKSMMSYKDILEMWEKRQLPVFVTDTTPTISRRRGDEIDLWLTDCPTDCQYVIIDDLDASHFYTHHYPRLLVVNPYYGLDRETAEKAVKLLNPNNDAEVLAFFEGKSPDAEGRMHQEIMEFDSTKLEVHHDYIQWIFPTMGRSAYNPNAPVITDNFTKLFQNSALAKANYCKSCQLYLNYMGCQCINGVISDHPCSDKRFYRLPYHNLLRITRVLFSLRQVGNVQCSKALYEYLIHTVEKNDAKINPTTLAYWKGTQT